MACHFIKEERVRKHLHKQGKRVAPVFMLMLDKKVERILNKAAGVHNGGKLTLDGTIGDYVGLNS